MSGVIKSKRTQFEDTFTQDVFEIHDTLRKTFASGLTLPISYRRNQLLQLARMVQENLSTILDSLNSDLGRTNTDSLANEITGCIVSAVSAANSLEEWTKPEKPKVEEWCMGWHPTIYRAPKGVAVVISPWNYPYGLSLIPFIGVIASGCTGIIKPSEHSPASSALLQKLFSSYLDQNAYRVIIGDASMSTTILDLKWDHILFTGSPRVGRIVAEKAAKHLTPCTLELGGKNPVFVDGHCDDLKVAARRILSGKQQNAGQLCVSPDYLLLHKPIVPDFLEALKEAYNEFYPSGAFHPSSNLIKIISPVHFNRIKSLLAGTKGKIVLGGSFEENKRIEPTVVVDVNSDDILMQDELFAPILPIITVDDAEEALRIINRLPAPLVVYVFTNDSNVKEQFINRTQSGSVVFNDTIVQVPVTALRFGGKGESGYGGYLGKHSFDEFSYTRGSVDVPSSPDPCMAFRYPPFTDEAYQAILGIVNMPIPDS